MQIYVYRRQPYGSVVLGYLHMFIRNLCVNWKSYHFCRASTRISVYVIDNRSRY